MYRVDDLGPESVIHVHDAASGMRGVLVVDCSVMGPCGGGTRMMSDISVEEIADLARGMTYKFGIHRFPRGGSKGGIWGDPNMPADRKRARLRAFGRALIPYLRHYDVACGPDMGLGVADVSEIYAGAGIENRRTGLFERMHEGDPLAYHLTGFGVVCAIQAACETAGLEVDGARVAIEGFGQVGAGVARYAARSGMVVVAVSTLAGLLFRPDGIDVPRLLELRRAHGDACVEAYAGAPLGAPEGLFALPVEVLVPGARPYVIDESNADRVRARIVVSGGNICITRAAEELLFERGILSVPDFVSNSGGMIASLVDFHGGEPDQAFRAIEGRIRPTTRDVLERAVGGTSTPYAVATGMVADTIRERRGGERRSFADTMAEIREMLGVF